jgi:AraC-like DNA-binding protein
MTALGFAHGGYMVPVPGTLTDAGKNADAELAAVGLPPDIAERPFQPIPHFLGVKFIDHAARLLGDEGFGLVSLAESNAVDADMVPPSSVAPGPGCLQVLQAVVGIMNRTTTSIIRLLDGKDNFWIDLQWTHGEGRPPWSAELYVMGLVLSAVRNVLGPDWQPAAMKMLSARSLHRESSGLPECPILWNSPTISLAINKEELIKRLAVAIPHQNVEPIQSVPNLSESSPVLVLVRDAIEGLMRQECWNLSDVADCFGLSKRSFQRRLVGLNLHFGEIVEDFRVERAMSALRQADVSVTDLSLELGYDHPQNFARAFRRCVGVSPRRYRSVISNPSPARFQTNT